ncbi:hypothetical protein [Bifidobacterium castoris]|uniref:Uncharacterized protein n=1 Tax=Bifidobacterium castoris TaxID=2306972 RepID=A0A430FAM0_9BIFI|nr:hypothetical protein [Bifidobacterium castoris]RSX49842.1 hypothetical protein D2E22_0303 [Bifidobacterium castoris]
MSGPVPDRFTPARLAMFLHVPQRFVRRMAATGLIEAPDADGAWTEPRLRAMLHDHPWLRILNVPLCARELNRINTAWPAPLSGPSVAGRRYLPLWRIMDEHWDRTGRTAPAAREGADTGGWLEPLF